MKALKSVVFRQSLSIAALLLRKRHARLSIIIGASSRILSLGFFSGKRITMKEKVLGSLRMLLASVKREYTGVSYQSMLIIVAVSIYLINPADAIPDIVPVLGFTDDFSLLLWMFSRVESELNQFLIWEQSQTGPM